MRLSAEDEAWVHMDGPRNRMIVTAVIVTERPLRADQVAELMASRLAEYPRFQHQAVGHGRRHREDRTEPFDIRQHVLPAELAPPGDEAALRAWLAATLERPLPRHRPRWELHVIERYGEGSALVWRIHHAVGDGASLLRILLSISDDAPPVESVLQPHRRGRRVSQGVRMVPGAAFAFARLFLRPADPRSRIKGPLSGTKRVAWSDPVALETVKEIARREGATVNDVLVTVLTGALRHYLDAHGCPIPQTLRAIIPFDLRSKPAGRSLGNRFGLLFLSLPIATEDPRLRLRVVRERMDRLKQSPEPFVSLGLLELAGRLSPWLVALGMHFFARKATVVLTNVAGPKAPLSIGGAPIREVEFWVPQVGALGLGLSIFSYAGTVRIGITSDAARVPDPERLAQAFNEEMARAQ